MKDGLRVAQKSTVGRVLKQKPCDFFHLSPQQTPPNGVLPRLGRVVLHMPLNIGKGIADEVGSVNEPSGNSARHFIGAALVAVVEPRFTAQLIDKPFAVGHDIYPSAA